MLSRITCLLFVLVSCIVISNRQLYNKKLPEHDKGGYYIYLPATIIYKDLLHFDFYPTLIEIYDIGGGNDYGLYDLPNGNKMDKYPVGNALSNLPFFLVAHLLCIATHAFPADGYSLPYRLGIIIGAVFWIVSGLLVLRKILRRHFSDNITALVILCLSLGTNVYFYTVFDPGMSHPYSFFLSSLILYLAETGYKSDRNRYIYLAGLALGLAVITRPVNIALLFILLLWKVDSLSALTSRIQQFSRRWRQLLIATIIFTAVLFLQLSYWKYVSGSWIFYSYKGEGFDLTHPRIWQGLFSYRKGWFVYTPIAFLGFLGLFFTRKKIIPALVLFFALIIFITFSWKNWYYGGSFSCRPLMDMLPLLAIPLGYLTSAMVSKQKIIKCLYVSLLFFFVGLNIFQSYQYSKSIIHWDRMTSSSYWAVFGRANVDDSVKQYLLPEQEYYDEIKSWGR